MAHWIPFQWNGMEHLASCPYFFWGWVPRANAWIHIIYERAWKLRDNGIQPFMWCINQFLVKYLESITSIFETHSKEGKMGEAVFPPFWASLSVQKKGIEERISPLSPHAFQEHRSQVEFFCNLWNSIDLFDLKEVETKLLSKACHAKDPIDKKMFFGKLNGRKWKQCPANKTPLSFLPSFFTSFLSSLPQEERNGKRSIHWRSPAINSLINMLWRFGIRWCHSIGVYVVLGSQQWRSFHLW